MQLTSLAQTMSEGKFQDNTHEAHTHTTRGEPKCAILQDNHYAGN